MSYTKGPWEWSGSDELDGGNWTAESVLEVVESSGNPYESYRVLRGSAEDRALISAAPDLYEAAKAALEKLGEPCLGYDPDRSLRDKLRAAIAKAEARK